MSSLLTTLDEGQSRVLQGGDQLLGAGLARL